MTQAAAAPAARGVFPLALSWAMPLAALSAVLYFIAFPGVIDWWPTALITWPPLFLALRGQTPRRAAWIGLFAGFIMSWEGFWWLNEMLQNFSGFNVVLCALFTTILCSYQAGRYALMGWLYARARQRGWPAAIVMAAVFVASEQLFPLLFPWYFADCVHSTPIFSQVADIGGPVFCSLLLLGTSVAIEEAIAARLEKRALDKRVVIAGTLATALSALYGFVRIKQVDAMAQAGDPLHVGYVQGNLGLMQNYTRPDEALRRHLRMTKELERKGVGLVVWSESSVTHGAPSNAYQAEYKNYLWRLRGVPTIFGGIIYDVDENAPRTAGHHREKLYNTALALDAHGDVVGRYDKEFLLAFGEYLPFGETFPILYDWSPNSGRFSSGTSLDPLPVTTDDGKKHEVSVLICYEDIIQSYTNRMVSHAHPELLVNMTNDAWFGDTSEPWEHLALSQFRAIEHHRYFVRATNSGVSAIIDPVGRVMVHSKPFDQESGDAIVHWLQTSTIYETVGDWPVWLITLFAIFAAFVSREKLNGKLKSSEA
ncbi:MAG TPA: apolipoprotein N-acyltransferase [Polyangiaceae bacterium]|jgi:apolipoprotein N-acyltransferase